MNPYIAQHAVFTAEFYNLETQSKTMVPGRFIRHNIHFNVRENWHFVLSFSELENG